jgi:hypothetical protein
MKEPIRIVFLELGERAFVGEIEGMRMDFAAPAMASSMGLAESSGRTMMERDIGFPLLTERICFPRRTPLRGSTRTREYSGA